jgi:hypothetical protein
VRERVLPRVHLDDLHPLDDLVHLSDSLVGPHRRLEAKSGGAIAEPGCKTR